MKTDLMLKFKQNIFSKVIWSSTFKYQCTVAIHTTDKCKRYIRIHRCANAFRGHKCACSCKKNTSYIQLVKYSYLCKTFRQHNVPVSDSRDFIMVRCVLYLLRY